MRCTTAMVVGRTQLYFKASELQPLASLSSLLSFALILTCSSLNSMHQASPMLPAALTALSDILSPPLRAILWRSVGLALGLVAVLAIALQRLLSWFATSGAVWLE